VTDLLGPLDHQLFGNPARAWLFGAAAAVLAYVALVLLRRTVVARLAGRAAASPHLADDAALEMLRRTRRYFFAAVAVGVGTHALRIDPDVRVWLDRLLLLLFLLQVGRWVTTLVAFWVDRHIEQRRVTGDLGSVTTIRALGYAGRLLLWLIVGITALETVFDYDVTALVTGLGIAGIAVALAVQNVLGDLLAAMAIVLDKPFVVGDAITVGEQSGTVEQIGLKTTRLRSVNGEQIIFANAELLRGNIRNFKRMFERRVLVGLDLHTGTPPDVLATIPPRFRAIVESKQPVRFDRSHVVGVTERAIRVETVYWVLDPDHGRHMDIQQAVLLEMLGAIREQGVSLAHAIIEEIRAAPG